MFLTLIFFVERIGSEGKVTFIFTVCVARNALLSNHHFPFCLSKMESLLHETIF